MHLTKSDLGSLSFPDSYVIAFSLDIDEKVFSVRCTDGYLDGKEGGRVLVDVELHINEFDSIQIREFANERLTPAEEYDDVFALKDICEFTANHDGTTLKGFSGQRGLWTEYFFSGGDVSGCYKS